ncbi:MAG: hypothetical protein ABI651_12415, partial [Verrucomicrobiota bacterium]
RSSAFTRSGGRTPRKPRKRGTPNRGCRVEEWRSSVWVVSALALVTLVRGRAGVAAILFRAAMFVFAISYTAFDTAAGVVTGVLLTAAHKSGTPDAWHSSIDTVWMHPIIGGSSLLIRPPFLAVFGSDALSIGTVAAAVSLKRAGSSWAPVVLPALAGFGIGVFKTHAWPSGPVTFGGLAVAGAWLLWERQNKDCR